MVKSALPAPEYLTWYGHDCFKIVGGGNVIVVDPFQLKSPQEPADIILITHEHFDHCSPKDFNLLLKPTTVVYAAAACGTELDVPKLVSVKPGERYELDSTVIETVSAYNLDKSFHPNDGTRVGFVISVEGQRIYHAGDADFIPEMKGLRDVSVALVPVSGMYVMSAEQAADAVDSFRPKLAIPMHYQSIIGSRADAERFMELAKVPVSILPQQV